MMSLAAAHDGMDLEAAIGRVIGSGHFVLGASVQRFEDAFARYCGTDHCIGVASGTDALELALRALGVGLGDRVATVANAGGYSTTAIRACGAVPVYIDVDPTDLTMSAEALGSAMADLPAAIVVTHLYGQLANVASIRSAAGSVPIVEDCAQAHGATRAGQRAGSLGDIGCFSFYPTKNLGALGDAGAVVTNDAEYADRIRKLRQYGWGNKYMVEVEGGRNSRLDESNAQRQLIAERYTRAVSSLPLELPPPGGSDYVAYLYVVRTQLRDALRRHLSDDGIGSEIHYPVADHQQRFAHPSAESASLPVTEVATATVLSLPCYPGLTEDQQSIVVEGITAFIAVRPSG